MKIASWVLLALVGVLTLAGSIASAYVAYSAPAARDEFGVGGPTVADVAAWRQDVALAVRARRGTASAYSAAFAVLLLMVVAGPYRRGDVWAWWAVLASTLVLAVIMLARVPLLDTRLGAGGALAQLGLVAVALALGAGRLRAQTS